MANVLFDTLPEWAKKKIEKAGKSVVQIVRSDGALQVVDGKARFNGADVVYSEDELTEEEQTINLIDTPSWVKREIRIAGSDGHAQIQHGLESLRISNGEATYNGARVIK